MTDWNATNATRESPDDHPNDHIDVALEAERAGHRILRFDVAGPRLYDADGNRREIDEDAEVARYRYEVFYDSIDTEQEVIDEAARYIYEELGVDVEVTVESPDTADGITSSDHIKNVDR